MPRKDMDAFAMMLVANPEWFEISKQKNSELERNEFTKWLADFAKKQGFDVNVEDIEDMNREYNKG